MNATTTLFYRDGKSDKFYKATIDGLIVTFNWGRRGTKGQSDVTRFGTFGSASDAYHHKLSEKRAKGYREEREIETIQSYTTTSACRATHNMTGDPFTCGLLAGHSGQHFDSQRGAGWPRDDQARRADQCTATRGTANARFNCTLTAGHGGNHYCLALGTWVPERRDGTHRCEAPTCADDAARLLNGRWLCIRHLPTNIRNASHGGRHFNNSGDTDLSTAPPINPYTGRGQRVIRNARKDEPK